MHTRTAVANFTVYEEIDGKKVAKRGADGKPEKDSISQDFDDYFGESDQDFKGCVRDARNAIGDEGIAKIIWLYQHTNHVNSIRPTSGGGTRGPSLMGKDTRETIKAAGAAGLTAAEIQAAILAAAEAKRSA